MSLVGAGNRPFGALLRSWLPGFLLLGLYLTLRGYHSFDGDQTYRLPLLLHRQDPPSMPMTPSSGPSTRSILIGAR